MKEAFPIVSLTNHVYGTTEYSMLDEVKRVGDNQVGIRTQCVLSKNAKKANYSTMGNLCLKINSKLGGLNSIIHEDHKYVLWKFYNPIVLYLGVIFLKHQ